MALIAQGLELGRSWMDSLSGSLEAKLQLWHLLLVSALQDATVWCVAAWNDAGAGRGASLVLVKAFLVYSFGLTKRPFRDFIAAFLGSLSKSKQLSGSVVCGWF